MNYFIAENVYIVDGATNGCIYDFNTLKMYAINSRLKKVLCKINNGILQEDDSDDSLKKLLKSLEHKGIITRLPQQLGRCIENIGKPNGKITFAWIEVTEKCNLKCRHCYNESTCNSAGVMSFSDFKLAIDNLVQKEVDKIQIIGGEPFILGQSLKRMLDYTIGKFSYIEIFTNGTLVTNEWFDYLKKNNIKIALSVYSYMSDMHDMVTGQKGSWEKVNNTIKKLDFYGVSYRVCNVLMRGVELGSRDKCLYTLNPEKDVVRMSGRGNFKLLSRELIKKRLITKKTFSRPLHKQFCEQVVVGHQCFDNKVYIATNLDVYPCVMERRMKHCNIKECDDILFDKKIRGITKEKIDFCKECEFRYACYDCRPDSLENEIYVKPWYCTYDPKSGKWSDEEEFIDKLYERWG